MSSQDRAVSPIEDIIPTTSYTRGEQAEETTIALERNPTEQREVHRGPASDVDSLSPSTTTHFSTDNAHPLREYHERIGAEETVGTAEPGETHAFLRENHQDATSTNQAKTQVKGNRVKLTNIWWVEVVSLTIAISALIAIMVALAEYNNKQQPAWKYAINLNTLIAILSTLMRACMVVVAEEVISQLKWMSFRQPRPIQDLTHFDAASRGPWGALLLHFRTRTLNAALLGCIVIILSIGIGPFTQQAVKTVPCDRPLESAEASIRISRYMGSLNLARINVPHWDMDMDTKVAILDGLANPNTTRSEVTPGCNTGNCIFPSYNGVTHSSVGMCKKCVDITPWVTELETLFYHPNGTRTSSSEQNLVLPGGHGIGGGWIGSLPRNIIDVSGHGSIWRERIAPLNDSLLDAFDDSFKSIFQSSILNVSVITFTNNGCDTVTLEHGQMWRNCSHHGFDTSYPFLGELNVVATACSFYPCVRDYHGSIRNTVFTEDVVRDTPIVQPLGQEQNSFPNFMHLHTPCLIDGQAYDMDNISSVPMDKHKFTSSYVGQVNMTYPTDCAYGVDGIYALSLVDFMYETLFGNCTVPSRINFDGDADDYNSVECKPWYLKGLLNKGNASFQSIDHNMQSIATAITSEMRKQGSASSVNLQKIYAKGTVMQTTVCTKFDWIWLSFPLALTVLTGLALCTLCGKMYFDMQKIPAWKSSVLPFLLTGNQIGAATGAEDMDKIKASTNNVVVSLAHFERGWEFVVKSCEDKKKKDS